MLSVLNDTLSVGEEPADRLVNRVLLLTALVESSSVTLRLVTPTLTVTVHLREKSTDPSMLLPEVEKQTERAVERAHTCVYHQLAVNTVELPAALTWRAQGNGTAKTG